MTLKAPKPAADPLDQANLDWIVLQLQSMILPIGAPIAWLASTVPTGFVEFDGGSTDGYPILKNLFGANLPDLRDKFIMGASGTNPVGTTGGLSTVTLTAAQSGLPDHTHNMPVAGVGVVVDRFTSGATTTNTYKTSGVTGGAQNASQAHENKPPFYAAKWITRAG